MGAGIDSGITDGATIVSTCDTTTSALGFIPGPLGMVADLANAGVSLIRGDLVGAGINVIAIVPVVGDAVKGGKMATKGAGAAAGAVGVGTKGAADAAGAGKVAAGAGQQSAKNTTNCPSGSKACFTEGTQIVVGAEYDENDVFVQYVTVNIEDIKVGDYVYSYDTITGTTELKEVTAVFALEADHINYLTIIDEQGNEQVIETTDSHPFWVVTDEPDLERAARSLVDESGVLLYHENIGPTENGFWVEAKDLREGDVFIGANGELSTFVFIERVVFPEGVKVYNFTVDGNHNYFVIAQTDEFGQTCVLVHNATDDYLVNALLNDPNTTLIKHGTKNRAAQHKRPGGYPAALIEFFKLKPKNVTAHQNGITGILANGTRIDIHMSSYMGVPTLGIQTSPIAIKIRFIK